MRKDEFTTAVSEKEQAEAVKEVSLKLKLVFPKQVDYLFILFTSQYSPSNILKTINLTLTPKKILGIQSPFLIFEGKVIQKGVIACCINKKKMSITETFMKDASPEKIEAVLRKSFMKSQRQNSCLLSFLSPEVNPSFCVKGIKMSLGDFFNSLGIGYSNKYFPYTYQILNDNIDKGLINLAIEGLKISSLKLSGYVPLGKPFRITKALIDKGIIMEINNKPAINIYKHYLESKFNFFVKNRLFSFYPFRIKDKKSSQLITVTDYLEDGSLICTGGVKDNIEGNLMFFNPSFLSEDLESKLYPIKSKNEGLVFIINSLSRRGILREESTKEIKAIKEHLGDNFRIIGMYSDYYFFSEGEGRHINIESGNLLLTLWQ